MAKGRKTGGRQKGSSNTVTRTAKEMLEAAAVGIGGLDALTQFGKDKPEIFWPMWARLLPKNVEMGGALEIVVRRE